MTTIFSAAEVEQWVQEAHKRNDWHLSHFHHIHGYEQATVRNSTGRDVVGFGFPNNDNAAFIAVAPPLITHLHHSLRTATVHADTMYQLLGEVLRRPSTLPMELLDRVQDTLIAYDGGKEEG